MMKSHTRVIIGLDMLIVEYLYLMIQPYSLIFHYSSLTDVLLCNSPVLHLRTVFNYLMCACVLLTTLLNQKCKTYHFEVHCVPNIS